MPETTTAPTSDQPQPGGGLLVARERIVAARTRYEQPSDGGSSGVSDTND